MKNNMAKILDGKVVSARIKDAIRDETAARLGIRLEDRVRHKIFDGARPAAGAR